jgi:hypothetical protein
MLKVEGRRKIRCSPGNSMTERLLIQKLEKAFEYKNAPE